jgi:hypothetical protein
MAVLAMRRELSRMRTALGTAAQPNDPLLERLRREPGAVLEAIGTPDCWQKQLMSCHSARILLLATRQGGKSTVAAGLSLLEVLLKPRSLVLLLSPTLRQSGELFRAKLLPLWQALGSPLAGRPPTQLSLELTNGSRVISLPENEEGVRCYSGVTLLVIDEAARVSESLYRAVRPMLAVSKGRLIALSTPFGKRGWFWESWSGAEKWHRVCIKASDCPRIDAAFLAEEKLALGERWYRQEYECSFEESVGAIFRQEDIDAAFETDGKPLFAWS